MKTVARLLELVLVFASIAVAIRLTSKWVTAEKRVSYLEGRWSVYEEMAEMSPSKLETW